jgi:23S rRNA-/tRNA-specific pseudouridylate synthase
MRLASTLSRLIVARQLCSFSEAFVVRPLSSMATQRRLVALETSGRSYDTDLKYQEALQTLQGAGMQNSDIGEVLATGIQLQAEALRCRLGYMQFLQKVGACSEQEARDLIVLQTRILEQRFDIVHEDDDYLVFNKPFDTKIDLGKPPAGMAVAPPSFEEGKLTLAGT